jgi:SHS family lactate transporter-like MFS transporter
MTDVTTPPAVRPFSWYREITPAQWRAFWAAFLGWVLDGFDFTILTFILIDIQRAFTIDRALAGALGTVTLFTRLLGGVLAGTAADRWGRKAPLMLSILWFALFSGLSGFSTSYTMLFALRALFGLGMGGVWTAGMPLALEHWPAHLRGVAAGLLQGGFSWGFMLAAGVFHFLYPIVNGPANLGWRVMLWVGVAPIVLLPWIAKAVDESPIWLERRRSRSGTASRREGLSFLELFRRDLLGTTAQTSLLMIAFMCSYYSISFWYATFLRDTGRETLHYLVALNAGAIAGGALWGWVAETRLGRRGAVSVAAILGLTVVPLFLYGSGDFALWLGALLMGWAGVGIFGMAPSYLTERFPTATRGVGAGFAYHAGAAVASITPTLLGTLQVAGWSLRDAMALGITLSGALVAAVVWLGPETRGRQFDR